MPRSVTVCVPLFGNPLTHAEGQGNQLGAIAELIYFDKRAKLE